MTGGDTLTIVAIHTEKMTMQMATSPSRRQARRVCFLAASALLLDGALLHSNAQAEVSFIASPNGDWFTDGNWSGGAQPTGADDTFVNNGGVAQILSNNFASAQNLLIGGSLGAVGGVELSTGTLTVALEFQIGGRNLASDGGLGVLGGTGTFSQTGGAVNVGSFTNIGIGGSFATATAATGTYTISNGTLNAGSVFAIGNGSLAVGHVLQTGGLVNSTGTVNLGRNNGTGFYDMQNGALTAVDLIVGGNGRGEFHQSNSATVSLGGNLNIGVFPSSTTPGSQSVGTYTMDGGTLTFTKTATTAIMAVGNGVSGAVVGFGTFIQNHGVVSMATNGLIDVGRGGGSGVYIMKDGTLTTGTIQFGTGSSGTFTRRFQLDGGVVNASTITFGGSSLTINSNRRFDMSGGSLTTGTFLLGGAAVFAISGGSLSIGTMNLATGTKLQTSLDLTLPTTITTGSATVQVDSNTLSLTGPITNLSRNLTKTGPGTLTLSGALNNGFDPLTPTVNPQITSAAGVLNLNTDGGANLVLNANGGAVSMGTTQHLAALNIGPGGSAELRSGADKVLVVGSLNLDGGSTPTVKLDLHDNDMVVNYNSPTPSPLSVIQAQISSAYASGAWNGNGITSTEAGASTTFRTGLGYAEASAVGLSNGVFSGVSLDGDAVLVRYTYIGDANIDGTVDTVDFNLLAASFGQSGLSWNNGDFNYDGSVDTIDFNNLAANFGQTLPGPAAGAVGTLVPEPVSALSAGAFAVSLLMGRRRRSTVAG
jgi:hypothetical protein